MPVTATAEHFPAAQEDPSRPGVELVDPDKTLSIDFPCGVRRPTQLLSALFQAKSFRGRGPLALGEYRHSARPRVGGRLVGWAGLIDTADAWRWSHRCGSRFGEQDPRRWH
jgi:hypothetical protein